MVERSAASVKRPTTRKVDIAWAALESFGEHGFERASLRDIARRAGLSHAGLLNHFTDKPELLFFALGLFDADAEDVALDAAVSATSPVDIVAAVLSHHQQTPDRLRAWLAINIAATQKDHPAHAYFAGRAELASRRFSGRLARAGHGNAERALLYLAVVDGLRLQWLANPALDVESALRLFAGSFLYSGPTEA